MSTVGTHATLLSSGAGYMAFAYVLLTAYLLIYYEFLSCFYCLLKQSMIVFSDIMPAWGLFGRQQRRREVEEKRSSERKLDRRS